MFGGHRRTSTTPGKLLYHNPSTEKPADFEEAFSQLRRVEKEITSASFSGRRQQPSIFLRRRFIFTGQL